MLVLAGPGSGKTHVISERVRYLIEEKGIDPGHILTITFTKAAAREMQSRCQRICPRAGLAVFGTFHSVFYHFLRKSEKYQNFTLINEKEKKEIMKKVIPVGNMTALQHAYVCENMLKKISYIKNSGKEAAEEEQSFRQTMERYCRLCVEQEKMDFDDMLVLCQELFCENEKEKEKWQSRFEYILVDEFQDINHCQYKMIQMLSEKHGNVFVVGDDDQAIYSFRGSDPGYMKCFLEDFPNSRQIFLDENYRSGTEIVELAGKSIVCNENRFAKNIHSVNSFEHSVEVTGYDSAYRESEAIADMVTNMCEAGEKGSVAVLVRTNAQVQYIAESLYKKKIPCSMKEKKKCFYDNPWVCDILAALRYVALGKKRRDFLVFMNKPFRGIERAMLKTDTVDLSRMIMQDEVRGNAELVNELKKMENCFRLMREMDPYGAVMLVLYRLNYNVYLERIAGENAYVMEQMKETTDELLRRARDFDSILQFLEFVDDYTDDFERENVYVRNKPSSETKVQLMTYHSSKGLEFDIVFLPMLNSGIVPHGHMLTCEQIEEERRMFYVAMTRAKRVLRLSWHGKDIDTEASVFLRELSWEKIGT